MEPCREMRLDSLIVRNLYGLRVISLDGVAFVEIKLTQVCPRIDEINNYSNSYLNSYLVRGKGPVQ
jgi:hypothetical protein